MCFKIMQAYLNRGETLAYAEDAVEVMIACVVNDGESIELVLERDGLPVTNDLVDELYELCERSRDLC